VSATSVHIRYLALQQFFRSAREDGEIAVSPMGEHVLLFVPEQPVPVISQNQLAA
jgi:hypothetical protein